MTGEVRPSGPYVQIYTLATAGPVRWRLLTGNNREIGRGVAAFEDVDACRAEFARVVANLGALVTSCQPAVSHRWTWRLSLDGAAVVVAAHTFDRRARCELAAGQFVREAPRALVRTRVLLSQPRSRPDRSQVSSLGTRLATRPATPDLVADLLQEGAS